MKTCNRCDEIKALTEFSKASTCKDGHRNYCKACQKLRKQQWATENKDRCNQVKLAWSHENHEKSREIRREWAKRNPEYHLEYRRQARKENPKKYRAWVSARRKRVQQATPPWADLRKIRDIYEQCPDGFHVDHTIPLKGKFVSGLHVEANLQYLPAADNMSKGAKFEDHG